MKGLDDHIHKEDAVHFQPARETPASWLRWSTFQPAKLVHFSTGLDSDCGIDRGESTWEDRCVDRLRVSAELLGVRRFRIYEALGSCAWSVSDA